MTRLPRIQVRSILAFALGIAGGLILDRLLVTSGVSALSATLGGAGVFTVGILALVLPELAAGERENKALFREHSDLLNAQVLSVFPSAGTLIRPYAQPQPLPAEGVPDLGWVVPGSGFTTSVVDLPNWDLARSHIETTPNLATGLGVVLSRTIDRRHRKLALDSVYDERIGVHVAEVFGPGFVSSPEWLSEGKPKWFNRPTLATWLQSPTPQNWVFSEEATGPFHVVKAGGRPILSSDTTLLVPASEFSKVYEACLADSQIIAAWQSWQTEDAEDQKDVLAYSQLLRKWSERYTATHRLQGRCEVCDGFRPRA